MYQVSMFRLAIECNSTPLGKCLLNIIFLPFFSTGSIRSQNQSGLSLVSLLLVGGIESMPLFCKVTTQNNK